MGCPIFSKMAGLICMVESNEVITYVKTETIGKEM